MQVRTDLLINKKYIEFLLPTLLTSMAISLATVVDGVIVGNLLGSISLAAVGLAGPVIFAINTIMVLFLVGGVTCASIAKGERDTRRADVFFTLSQAMGAALLIVFAALVTAYAQPLSLLFARGDTALAKLNEQYISSIVWTGPFMHITLSNAQFWKLDGKPAAATRIALIANASNLLLDYILIKYCNAGIMGAGISTAIGYLIGTVYIRLDTMPIKSAAFILLRRAKQLCPISPP